MNIMDTNTTNKLTKIEAPTPIIKTCTTGIKMLEAVRECKDLSNNIITIITIRTTSVINNLETKIIGKEDFTNSSLNKINNNFIIRIFIKVVSITIDKITISSPDIKIIKP